MLFTKTRPPAAQRSGSCSALSIRRTTPVHFDPGRFGSARPSYARPGPLKRAATFSA